jgi:hypothetical protein
MRFSALSVVAALPLLAAGAEAPFEQYKAQFQNFMDKLGAKIPNPGRHDHVEAAATKSGPKRMDILTLDNWQQTLLAPVKPTLTTPVEWWVLVTGGNKTCFGTCFLCLHCALSRLRGSC